MTITIPEPILWAFAAIYAVTVALNLVTLIYKIKRGVV